MAGMPLNDHTAVERPTTSTQRSTTTRPPRGGRPHVIGPGRLVSTVVNAPDANYPSGGSRTSTGIGRAGRVLPGRGQRRPLTSPSAWQPPATSSTTSRRRPASPRPARPPTRRSWNSRRTSPTPGEQVNSAVPVRRQRDRRLRCRAPPPGGDAGDEDRVRQRQLSAAPAGSSAARHAPVDERRGLLRRPKVHVLRGGDSADLSQYLVPGRRHRQGRRRQWARPPTRRRSRPRSSTRFDTRLPDDPGRRSGTSSPTNPTTASAVLERTRRPPGQVLRRAARDLRQRQLRRSPGREIRTDLQVRLNRAGAGRSQSTAVPCRTSRSAPATKLDAFFKQWWSTGYTGSPAAGNKPQITGPGLAGSGFYDANGGCSDYGDRRRPARRRDRPATLS